MEKIPTFLKKNFLQISTCLLILSGCSSAEEKYVDRSVNELYNEAMDALTDGKLEKAATTFEEVDRQHPYSEWAPKAQVMAAYSYYESQKYEKALATIQAYIQLYPAHADVAYAHYLEALCFYEQMSPIRRDQKNTELALNAFTEVLKRFPETSYAKDAKVKIDLLQDSLAAKEMMVARDYLDTKAYIAALNRFQKVVSDYQTTSQVPEALHRMAEIYLLLGMKEQAQKAAAVLGHNYPGSPWYADSYYLLTGKDMRSPEAKNDSWFGWFDFSKDEVRFEQKDPHKSRY